MIEKAIYEEDTRVINENFDCIVRNLRVCDKNFEEINKDIVKIESNLSKIGKKMSSNKGKIAFLGACFVIFGYSVYAHMNTIDKKIDDLEAKIDEIYCEKEKTKNCEN